VASRTRSRSGSDNGSPRPVKRLNLGPPGCGGAVVQQVTCGQSHQVSGNTKVISMNYLDPRVIYARQVATARAAAQEADDANDQDSAGHQPEYSSEESSRPSTNEVDQEEAGNDADEQAGQDAGEAGGDNTGSDGESEGAEKASEARLSSIHALSSGNRRWY